VAVLIFFSGCGKLPVTVGCSPVPGTTGAFLAFGVDVFTDG
jgi:hypothetical protein